MAQEATVAPTTPAAPLEQPMPAQPVQTPVAAKPVEDRLCGLREVMWAVGAAGLIVAAVWLGRRFASLPRMVPALLAGCLLVSCSAPVYLPGVRLQHGYEIALEAPTPPVPPAPTSSPVPWIVVAAVVAGAALFVYLWRKKP